METTKMKSGRTSLRLVNLEDEEGGEEREENELPRVTFLVIFFL
jgi:hypothetical protein